MVAPKAFLDFIDDHGKELIDRLKEAVAIPSVSGDPARREDVKRMAAWLLEQLGRFGVNAEAVPLGEQIVDGTPSDLDLPPILLGRIGADPKKPTVLIYGHYDVQPAQKSDGWTTEPFELHVDYSNDKMTGRGTTDDKGPVLGWVNVLEAHHALGIELPVNLRFCFEGMEESGCEGLDALVAEEAAKGDQGYFDNVDCICISDTCWLNTNTPGLTYGLRGVAYFHVTISGPGADLHSGFGGSVFEPMTDLIALMSKLVTSDARILIPGIYDGVKPASEEEIELYNKIDFSVADVEQAAGGKIAISDDKATVLMGRMRNPSLSLHGIVGASSGVETKTVIPARVTGKFSLRLVPPQTPEDVKIKVETYLRSEFAKLNTKNTLESIRMEGGSAWVEDYKHYNYEAAKNATEVSRLEHSLVGRLPTHFGGPFASPTSSLQEIWLKTPDFFREGGSIPVTLTFAEKLGKNIVLLPMGRGDDGAHSTNEKVNISNYLQGSKLLGAYLYEVAKLAPKT
ncbi:hypothetical protein NLI96_g289 [Meripilus lineatus]|uniref:Peptidase M20 dimerisation domain-containing protein n=1 Tax=Meripilus lineatus TaxID=2056292 RepID=A0AAD5VCL1_9APHY|nr:hypothetical protein NLI96_g289 [Physisporinus lineatus]